MKWRVEIEAEAGTKADVGDVLEGNALVLEVFLDCSTIGCLGFFLQYRQVDPGCVVLLFHSSLVNLSTIPSSSCGCS
jgi:hypothetical protein